MTGTERLQVDSREAVRLVAAREITVRLRSKAYLVTLFISVIAFIAIPVVSNLAKGHGGGGDKIAVLSSQAQLATTLQHTATGLGGKITIVTVPDHATGVQQVKDKKVNAFAEQSAPGTALDVTVDTSLSDADRALLTVAAEPASVLAQEAASQPKVTTLNATDPLQGQRITIAIVAGLLMYMSLMLVGQGIAQGVVEEKSSRVVELLLSTLRPWQLLAGKVVGNGVLGLIQVAVPAFIGIGVALATNTLTLSLGNSLGTVAWALAWYVVGFTVYALAFAGLGATVSRQEDVGGLVFPATAPLILAWVVGISVVPSDPTSSLVTWLSMLPPCAPVLMPMRIAMGVAPVWQIVLELALTAAFGLVLLRFAARIYRNSVLRSGARVPLREALKAA